MNRIITEEIYIPQLDRKRIVRVFLPKDYYDNKEKHYPVIYMHDGQNLFEPSGYSGYAWEVDKTLDRLQQDGITEGLIVVGIHCNQEGHKRLDEYSPWESTDVKKLLSRIDIDKVGGEGGKYIDFIVTSLKPMIDSRYRTLTGKENTYMVGSSMGGFISLFAGTKYQDKFSIIGAFSTAVWFEEEKLLKFISESYIDEGMKFYLDVGTKETSDEKIKDFPERYINGTINVYEVLRSKISPENIKLIIDEGATHSEKYWSARFVEFIKWISKK